MHTETVDDQHDPRVADYVGLRDGPTNELAIVEGLTALQQLTRSPYPIRSVLCLPKRLDRVATIVGSTGATVLVADEHVLKATVGFDLHRGVVAAAERIPLPDPTDLIGAATRIAVLEGVNDLENLGSLFRNAAAFAIDAVLLDPTCADPLYRRPIRVSMGHALTVPFARFSSDHWPGGLQDLKAAGFGIIALTPAGTTDLTDLHVDRPAVVLGAEGPGLSATAMDAADIRCRIEMAPGVDSLNVATAAAIAFYAMRTR